MKEKNSKQKKIKSIICFIYVLVGIILIIGIFMIDESNLNARAWMDRLFGIYGIIGTILVIMSVILKKRNKNS